MFYTIGTETKETEIKTRMILSGHASIRAYMDANREIKKRKRQIKGVAVD
jgi:hypothetical protein